MALADPQTVSTVALARVSDDNYKSEYWSADRTAQETIESRILSSGRTRHVVRYTQTKVAADPLTALNKTIDGTVTLTFDLPAWGFTEAEKIALLTGINTQLSASTNAVLKAVLSFQH